MRKKILLRILILTLFMIIIYAIPKNISKAYEFESDLKGSTGWSTINMSIRTNANEYSKVLAALPQGKSFLILSEQGNYWKIQYSGKQGYVNHNYCMINLPDVMPSIVYNITNESASIYKSSGIDLPNVTGKQLYKAGKVMNNKIGKEEYPCPVLYSTAKKIANAQKLALSDGYCLKIYDAYRPHEVSKNIYNSLLTLYNSNSTVRNNINYSTGASGRKYQWGTTWFLAGGVSSHNTGAAIDVTLCDNITKKECIMPTAMHELSTKAIKYYYPNVWKYASNYSKEMNESAKKLDSYMTKSGMTTLASEWWHFQEQAGYTRIKNKTNGKGCTFFVTDIVSESQNSKDTVLDVNNDGIVNIKDASEILSAYAKSCAYGIKANSKYDVNGDGIVNSNDASYVLSYYSMNAAFSQK